MGSGIHPIYLGHALDRLGVANPKHLPSRTLGRRIRRKVDHGKAWDYGILWNLGLHPWRQTVDEFSAID